MSRVLSVSLYGCGSRTQMLVDSIYPTGKIKISACYDLRKEQAEAVAKKYSARAVATVAELINDPQAGAFLISLFPGAHKDALLQVAPTGKPIFIEKPFGTTGADAKEAWQCVKKHGNICRVGLAQRYVPVFKKVGEMIAGGEVGEVLAVHEELLSLMGPNLRGELASYDWRQDAKTGGELLQHSCHDFDRLRHWVGEIVSVIAQSNHVIYPKSLSENNVHALFMHANGKTMTNFSLSLVSRFNNHQGLIIGSAATLFYEWREKSSIRIYRGDKCPGKREPDEIIADFSSEIEDRLIMEEFLREARGEQKVAVTAEDGMRSTLITEAIRESCARGCRVNIDVT